MRKSETWVITWSKDGNTKNPLPGGKANFNQKETKHIHTRSSLILNLIKTRQRQATQHVIYLMKASMCLSQSIADTLNYEPKYICSKDPKELIRLFYQSLVQRQIILKDDVEERYIPKDLEYLPNKQQKLIKQWCGQVPVIGFNSGRYDLNLIRKYFISHLGQEKVDSGEKQGQIMYMKTPQFVFLDVINYLAPGITYDKWVKTYGAKQTKSWLPYEWFDSADKLDYKGLLL